MRQSMDGMARRIFSPARYYQVAERVYRGWTSDNPYEVQWIPTDSVVRFSGRDRATRSAPLFGTVRGGDWDIEPPDYGVDCQHADLAYAPRLDETVFYRSLHARFVDGAAWEDTEFIREMRKRCRLPGFDWGSYKDQEAITVKCVGLDAMWRDIGERGVRPYREILVAEGRKVPFLKAMAGEVLVDCGRRDLLLVDGKHRVSIAKIMGIEQIPVVTVVRHIASPGLAVNAIMPTKSDKARCVEE